MTDDTCIEDIGHKLNLRHLTLADYEDVKKLMDAVYPGLGGAWPKNKFRAQLKVFPDGQICIEDHGVVVAAAFSVIVDYDKFGDQHTYDEITGDAYLTTHDPLGDVLYGVDVFVSPDYRAMRLGRRLYEARKEICQNLNLKSIVAGGRIPKYKDHAKELTPQAYIEKVKRKELYDPILTFQLSNEFEVRRVLKNYLPEDQESHGYATLLEWNNLYYDPEKSPLIGATKTSARIGCVQWQMRAFSSVEELSQQIEFFIDALSDYQCDVALFPEFFNAPLMGIENHATSIAAVKALSEYSVEIVEVISKMAVTYNINVIAGSIPVIENDELFNVSYLCRRDGTIDSQYKLHVTPHEKRAWIMQGGDKLKVFDTDFGRIGILICYDVEFPELGRLLSEQGVQILFVPFWTDTKNGYLRVRCCAQARAIENECYVAIAGSVGNLPKVDGADIQYAQSAVFSPSDFAFPHDAIMAETTPNTEMTLVVDLDLDKLNKLQNEGSVRNYLDRRRDLYKVSWIED
ncbi:carbon-nitrogen hydrolase family protein [Thalassotalea piscium]|uniref:Putative amidohydrolase/GNAT superfamily N-acetyltransferase n=1 Tax=Thalassotalea piscium TaxID=1230533 RepID=A0A7X0NFD4_9GAMM|nr:bifunctional GNAT family N-acetyltransferase/carbon-nitrogen hydrolase family protein [Thalassotalea piscium]MBB6542427.1 putative amidohydrolase/GNAT superfamily N-acetyltransferase [Thalassotalea piscium]